MHNIAVINGRESMAYSGCPPWHDLGSELSQVDSVEVAIQEANLDWQVRKEAIFLAGQHPITEGMEEGTDVKVLGPEIPDIKAVVRDIDNAILGTVGSRYQLIQNAEAFAPLQYAIDQFGASVETAGALGKGDRVWMLVKLTTDVVPEQFEGMTNEVIPGDRIDPYVLVTNSHTRERSQGLIARFTPVRVVCQNTLDAALSTEAVSNLSIRHTSSAQDKIEQISTMIESVLFQHYATIELYQQLRQVDISIVDMAQYCLQIWPVLTDAELEELAMTREEYKPTEEHYRRNSIFLFQNGNGHELAGSTAYGAYQAVTEMIDHVSVMRLDGKRKTQGSMNALFGTGAQTKKRALEIARENWLQQ